MLSASLMRDALKSCVRPETLQEVNTMGGIEEGVTKHQVLHYGKIAH